jgi:hypothetical protein
MAEPTALLNLGELSKPATVFIEKISAGIGALFEPRQIVRVAKAEAEAELIRAQSQLEISDLHRRALWRFLQEEARKQNNIEQIIAKAIPQLDESAQPDQMDDDWIANFFDQCRLTSDDQVQQIWSRILAGEANSPGSFSRRTVNFLGSLDKSDAEQFSALCSFCWVIGRVQPLVFDSQNPIYTERGVTFSALIHLESIGLVQLDHVGGFTRRRLSKNTTAMYFDTPVELLFPNDSDNTLDIGTVLLTRVGQELAPICRAEPVPEFLAYVRNMWRARGYLNEAVIQEPVSTASPPNVEESSRIVG